MSGDTLFFYIRLFCNLIMIIQIIGKVVYNHCVIQCNTMSHGGRKTKISEKPS